MIGIIGALPFEMQELLSMSTHERDMDICDIHFYICKIGTNEVVIAACGEGKVNAARCTQIMISVFDVDIVINIGVAGSLSNEAPPGSYILASAVVQHDYDMTAIGVPLGLVPRGKRNHSNPWGESACIFFTTSQYVNDDIRNTLDSMGVFYNTGIIATGDKFIANSNEKRMIVDGFSAIACEMEGGAIAQTCSAANIGFAEIRVISDNADEEAGDYYLERYSQYSIGKILFEVLSKNKICRG